MMTLSRRQLLASVFAAPVVGMPSPAEARMALLKKNLELSISEMWEDRDPKNYSGLEVPVVWRNPITGKWASCDEAGNVLSQGDRLNHEKFFELLMGRKP